MFALSADGDAPRGQHWTAAPFTKSRDDPSPFVDVELHQALLSHFQQEGLASFLIDDVGALHDLVKLSAASREARAGYFLDHSTQPDSHIKHAGSVSIRKLVFRNHSLNIL